MMVVTGDTVQFAEYVERNLRLQQMRNNHPLRPQSAASWVRRAIADSLRSRTPYSVNILLGGYDVAGKQAKLYWMDYLGTQTDVPFAAHGYGSYFALSLLDRYVFYRLKVSSKTTDAYAFIVTDTTTQKQTLKKAWLY